jgi:hypothetical protein
MKKIGLIVASCFLASGVVACTTQGGMATRGSSQSSSPNTQGAFAGIAGEGTTHHNVNEMDPGHDPAGADTTNARGPWPHPENAERGN